MINKNVMAIRLFLRLSQQDFGRLMGYTEGYVSKVESGQSPVSDKFRERLCTQLGVKPETLLYSDMSAPTSTRVQ